MFDSFRNVGDIYSGKNKLFKLFENRFTHPTCFVVTTSSTTVVINNNERQSFKDVADSKSQD
jgi:hypothetical protein